MPPTAPKKFGIRYRSAHNEDLPLVKPQKRYDEVRHSEFTISLIRDLSASMDDAGIAFYLKREQIYTKNGTEFTIPSIKWIRYKHKIPNLYQNNH